jgi:deoxyribodipyrimidine photolyase-related protein
MTALVVFPHQLQDHHPGLHNVEMVVLVEAPLLFSQYRFHRQKLLLHRASMKSYQRHLAECGHQVHYLEAGQLASNSLAAHLKKLGCRQAIAIDPCDDWLTRQCQEDAAKEKIEWRWIDDPHWLTPIDQFDQFAQGKKKLFFTEFYIDQRKRQGILLDAQAKPLGGQWSFDPENRKKLPKGLAIPALPNLPIDDTCLEASDYVERKFPESIGDRQPLAYPWNRTLALEWLNRFVDERLANFGDYEDAIDQKEPFLFHSVLTPMLNIGLIQPKEVVQAAVQKVDRYPINSIEGFIRQVIGWREYMRGVYLWKGRAQRSRNAWEHHRAIPPSVYRAQTGIDPLDAVLRRVYRWGYCHHIERLMILGNFFFLCEVHPDEVYRWFMECFIDAYDWVMVPNVYGMSQQADGGWITTKPYISGSAYVKRMSDFREGPWCEVWDALYWRMVAKHREAWGKHPRMRMIASQIDRMAPEKLASHLQRAEEFLESWSGGEDGSIRR